MNELTDAEVARIETYIRNAMGFVNNTISLFDEVREELGDAHNSIPRGNLLSDRLSQMRRRVIEIQDKTKYLRAELRNTDVRDELETESDW
ncbi:hypothetical protein G7Y41_08905 [Schaalia sp. ZJ405]|uniref:hypothetical protein n=1 Tax=Schaalia sp. ZJ405 TaxID=2709403 RepID=UPI0013EBD970|nr:hypothetical protein [Schaalia sp. ZJ405]QPK81144.1 hypothetical protein G7Y41_08905 [Schaalia sp. ZJ405]